VGEIGVILSVAKDLSNQFDACFDERSVAVFAARDDAVRKAVKVKL
jgi:hypothetical protein